MQTLSSYERIRQETHDTCGYEIANKTRVRYQMSSCHICGLFLDGIHLPFAFARNDIVFPYLYVFVGFLTGNYL